MHQPQVGDTHPLAPPPSFSPPAASTRPHPCSLSLTLSVFLAEMLHLCFHSDSLNRSVFLFLWSHPPNTLHFIPLSLLSVPTLQLTWRESCGNCITLRLGSAYDLLSTQSLFPNDTSQRGAEVEFSSASCFLWRDSHSWHTSHSFTHKKHTPRRGVEAVCVLWTASVTLIVTLACHNPVMHVSLLLCFWPWCSHLCHPSRHPLFLSLSLTHTHTHFLLLGLTTHKNTQVVFHVNQIYSLFQVVVCFIFLWRPLYQMCGLGLWPAITLIIN